MATMTKTPTPFKKQISRKIRGAKVTFILEEINNRYYLKGIDAKGETFELSPLEYKVHRRLGPSRRPLVCLAIATILPHQSHLLLAPELDRMGIVSLLPCRANGYDLATCHGKTTRYNSTNGAYIMAEICHPKLLP
jgi:hypothetical protein